jgi:acyl-coenzyme A thioesterase PaaI-like protein
MANALSKGHLKVNLLIKEPDALLEDELFRSIPWCASILSDPDYRVIPTAWRWPSDYNSRMDIFARTLKTTQTISAWCSILRRPEVSSRKVSDILRILLALRSGLDGAPGRLQGGVTSMVFDAAVSMMTGLAKESVDQDGFNVTKELTIRYLAPVLTPSEVMIEAKVVDIRNDRRYSIQADMKDKTGKVMATAEAVCIIVPRPANL